MTIEEASKLIYEKYDCENRGWATGVGDGVIYIYVNALHQGTVLPLYWTDGGTIDNVEGIPVIFRRMDVQIGKNGGGH